MSRLVNSGILKFRTTPYLIAGVYSSNQSLKSYLYITRDLGASWQMTLSQYQSWGVVKTSSDGQHIFAGSSWGGAWISHDAGTSWSAIFVYGYNRAYADCQISDDGLMIVATHGQTNILISLDGGLTYIEKVIETGRILRRVALAGDKSMMLVTVNNIIYVSYNQGSSWAVYDPMGLGATNWVGVGLNRDGSVIYLLRQQWYGIYISTNGGVNWSNTLVYYPKGQIDLTPDGKRAIFSTSMSYIAYTDDFGASVQNITINAISSPTINGSGSLIIISQEEAQPTEMIRRNDGAGGTTLTQMYDTTNTIVGFRQYDYRQHALAQPKL